MKLPNPARPAPKVPSRFAIRPAAPRARPDSHAAYLVLLTSGDGARALLFNAAHRYLTDVVDDPLTVDHLRSAGHACELPAVLAQDRALAGAANGEILCFALGGH